MKKVFSILILFMLLLSACSKSNKVEEELSEIESVFNTSDMSRIDLSSQASESVGSSDMQETKEWDYMKAVWITQFDMMAILKKDGIQRDKESFTELYKVLLNNLKNDGYNTVIVQVRPYADSFYPSELFPVSNYVSGAFGNENIYDPFEIIVSLAKEYELSVHAWLNPMRGMRTNEISSVPDKYLIKQWYNDPEIRGKYVVEYDGRIYLNPAYAEVRKLIADGAGEAVKKYDIDGVHIDDYFYPTTDASFDKIAYEEYKQNGGSNTLSKFRNEMLDLMVSEMYSSIKSVDEDLQFGISPVGNIDITYTNLYTDVYKWCSEEGYIDYICPQIYFGLEHQTHDFVKVYNTWNSIIKNDKVRIIVGMSLGKAKSQSDSYAGTGKNEWAENKDVIKRCLEFLSTQEDCAGIIMFCYQHMYDPVTGESVEATVEERHNMKNALYALGEN